MPTPAMTLSAVKAYALPLILFSLFLFYQLAVLPRFFPPSHYDVLGIKRYGSVEEVKEAYEKLSSNWNSGVNVPSTIDFIKVLQIRYAYELLTNPLWKRDYDIFSIDEQHDVIEKIAAQYAGEEDFSRINLPFLDASASDHGDYASNVITSQNFTALFNDSRPSLVLVYSRGSSRCARFSVLWKEIAALLDGVVNTGMVELGEVRLAVSLAERKPTGQLFFRNGLPSLLAVPPGCKTLDCLTRFEGDLSVDVVTDWFTTTILNLPRILYHSKDSLADNFLRKGGHHKVKIIFFSKTGKRATPFVRQIAKNYSSYASFAFVLWREEDFSFWWNVFEVESAPAIFVLKDPGVKPIVFHGLIDNTEFLDIMEKNKQHELPQLRSVTSKELGCDPRGHSRAGNDVVSWYCVILAGRLSPELDKMRATMRRVQELLTNENSSAADDDESKLLASVLKSKRLTFAWLDGEAQHKYCFFYLHSETIYDTCGPRRDVVDIPRLFIVRYKRNATQEEVKIQHKPKNIFSVFEDEDVDPASQLVARYNSSEEISEIIQWISMTVRDGDTRDLPFFTTRTPDLVPEDSDPIWSKGSQGIFSKSNGIKHKIHNMSNGIHDCVGDPRVGALLLVGVLVSSATIWLKRNQPSRPSPPSQPNQSTTDKDEATQRQRDRARKASKEDAPTSITDFEPIDAYQMPLLDSDSE
ncbi:hypothetical protein K2173_028171 [Erythroxylum novogranatense]|uniref:J domain-containing protein n=1 Tax=Erythroxylum novogranatense TaxID=1862640 RepID=A0AAV8U4F0_9ROSI|nr:hypothetical protein K2173_028171 [Erythroxylum novogranatense]